MNMSVGTVAPISNGTPPSPNRRPDPRPTHKVSFKLTRPKPSKVKHLTASELKGIGMSIVLSLLIALTIVFIGVKIAPLIFSFALDLARDLLLGDPSAVNQSAAQIRRVSRYLTVNANINCSYFASKVANVDALLFSMPILDNHFMELLNSRTDLRLHLQTIESIQNEQLLRISHNTGMNMTLQEYRDFEWSLNPHLGSTNHFVTDTTLLTTNASLTASLTSPSLPDSATTHDQCTLRNPPFRDFTADAISFGKNTTSLSGRNFHAHRRSVSVLLTGRKHWVVYAPTQIPADGFNPLENLHDWRTRRAVSASMSTTTTVTGRSESSDTASASATAVVLPPIEIIQEAGQAVYIPEGWYHATQTLSAESVSVRFMPPDEQAGQYLYYLLRGDQKIAVGDAAAAVKLYRLGLAIQKDAILLTHLGRALEQLGLYAEAEGAYKDAIIHNPRDPFTYTMLINLFVSHSSKDASSGISELLERADSFDLKSTVLELMKDSF